MGRTPSAPGLTAARAHSIFMQTKPKPKSKPPQVGELSLAIASKLPEHEEIQARYLKPTKKRPARVKLNYRNRRSVTVEHNGAHYVVQAAVELLERGVKVSSFYSTEQNVTRFAVEPMQKLTLDAIFTVRKTAK